MTEKVFERLYRQFRLEYAKKVFSILKEREGSLSAQELLSAEVIFLLDKPTVKQFADFLNISSPNAAYKVKTLTEKGYIVKEPSPKDGRESLLRVTDKFLGYYAEEDTYGSFILRKMKDKLTVEEMKIVSETMKILNEKVFND